AARDGQRLERELLRVLNRRWLVGGRPVAGQRVVGGDRVVAALVARVERVRVPGHRGVEQRHRLLAARLPLRVVGQALPLARLDRHRALKIRQREVGLAVTAVHRAEQREERRVLRYRQQLAVARGPAGRGEVVREDADLCYE